MADDVKDGYVVLFGGYTNDLNNVPGSSIAMSNETWTYSRDQWTLVSKSMRPEARIDATMAYDPSDGYVVLFGGVSAPYGGAPGQLHNDTWVFSAGVWTRLHPIVSPAPRAQAMMAYDSTDGEIVLFGGTGSSGDALNDTWAFAAGGWTLLNPSTRPPARNLATMADDPRDHCMLLFGGVVINFGSSSDTWAFAGGNWRQITSTTSPLPRQAATMAYDAADSEVVLFGGEYNTMLADTWAFANGNWAQQSPTTTPTGRFRAAMVFVAGDGYIFLWGGSNSFPTLFGDDWSFSAGQWTQRTRNWPLLRTLTSLAYDAPDGYVVMYAGLAPAQWAYGDTWMFVNGNWTPLSPPTSPPPRWGGAMAYDARDGYVVLYGGYSYSLGVFSDTWMFLHGKWTQLQVSGPPALSEASLTYDTRDACLVLFGGWSVVNGYPHASNATWEFSGGQWRQAMTSIRPPARYDEGLVYDAKDGYVMLFGGLNAWTTSGNMEYFNDTWAFAAGIWRQVHPGQSPLPRGMASVAYDATAGVVILLGGQYGNATFFGPLRDEWGFSNGAWVQISGSLVPPDGSGGAMALSVPDTSLLLFGWDGNSWTGDAFQATARSSASVIEIPQNVTLTGTAEGGAPPYSYRWDLGDGRNFTGSVAVAGYATAGNYSILLAVADARGSGLNVSLLLQVVPTLRIQGQIAPATGRVPLVVQFVVTTSGGLPPFAVAWSFGDGTTASVSEGNHTYSTIGTFDASLNLTDALGVVATLSAAIVVQPQPLTARATASTQSGVAPLMVEFHALAQGGMAPYGYKWVFGDNGSSTLANATHTYATPGQYLVRLNVTDAAGSTVSAAMITVTVSPAPQPPPEGLSPTSVAVLIAAIAVLGAAFVAYLLLRRRVPRKK